MGVAKRPISIAEKRQQ